MKQTMSMFNSVAGVCFNCLLFKVSDDNSWKFIFQPACVGELDRASKVLNLTLTSFTYTHSTHPYYTLTCHTLTYAHSKHPYRTLTYRNLTTSSLITHSHARTLHTHITLSRITFSLAHTLHACSTLARLSRSPFSTLYSPITSNLTYTYMSSTLTRVSSTLTPTCPQQSHVHACPLHNHIIPLLTCLTYTSMTHPTHPTHRLLHPHIILSLRIKKVLDFFFYTGCLRSIHNIFFVLCFTERTTPRKQLYQALVRISSFEYISLKEVIPVFIPCVDGMVEVLQNHPSKGWDQEKKKGVEEEGTVEVLDSGHCKVQHP